MEYEQISAFDADALVNVSYSALDNDGKIYAKLDWLTMIFTDCSMRDVLSWLTLSGCVADFYDSISAVVRGYDDVFKFNYNGVRLETSSVHFYGMSIDLGIFDVVVPKLRLELSGAALDFMRTKGIDFDYYRFNVPLLPPGGAYHITRADIAYDFINYQPAFIDELISYVANNKLPSERVPICNMTSGITCRVVTGGQKTVYLGSPQADRMLRCYDKRMQCVDLNTGVYITPNPYQDPDSWFRIEWQLRNKFAHNIFMDPNIKFKHILKMIFEKYAFASGDCKYSRDRVPVDFWLNLFDWSDVESRLVQNANFVQFREPDEQLVDSFEKTHIRSTLLYLTLLGKAKFVERCNKYLMSLHGDDPRALRRLIAFCNKINEIPELVENLNKNTFESQNGLFVDAFNKFHFNI